MKKSARNRIIIWSVVSFVLIAVLISGLFVSRSFGRISFGIIHPNVDFSEYKTGNAEFEADSVKSLNINWTSGNVEIIEVKGDSVKIYEESQAEEDKMYYRLDGGKLTVYDSKKVFNLFSFDLFTNRRSKKLTVEIPKTLELSGIDVNTASADVNADDINAEDISVNCASGDILLSNVSSGSISMNNVSGSSYAQKSKCSEIDVNTVSGDTNISTYSDCREIDVQSVSGGIELNVQDIYTDDKVKPWKLGSIDAESVSGGINLNFSEGIKGFSAELGSVSGSKTVNFDTLQKDDKYVFGDGSVKINLDTVSGGIEIDSINE